MPGNFIKAITASALILSASYAAPAWSAGKSGNCPHAKSKIAKRSTPVAPARSVMVVERRKLDVQVLSFGP